ncbi:MAG: MATE family efflux transporter [Clostridiales bacterium]|nr:MATE family efflux transporter [Clostridiales bacterium]
MTNLKLLRRRWDKDYTSALLTVALPVTVQNLISIGLNLVDVLMIGWVGVPELAAVGAANRIYSIFGMLCFGLVSGFSVYVAQYWGVRDIKNIRRVFGLALRATGILALLFVLMCLIFPRPLLHLFVKEAAVLYLGQKYLSIAIFSYPLIAMSMTTSFVCRAIRRLRGPTLISAIALGFSTLLRYALIFGNWGFPCLGVTGAAIATVAGRLLELTLLALLIYATRCHPLAGKPKELFSANSAMRQKILRTAFPVMINEGCFIGGITGFYIAVGFLGTAAVAVMQVASVLSDFFQAIFYGFGNAVAVITGNALGRGHTERAYQNGQTALAVTLVLGLIMGTSMIAARGFIVQLYDFNDTTSALLSSVIIVYSIYMTPRMLAYVEVCGLLRAGGDTRFCMFVDATCSCFIGVCLAFCGVFVLRWQLPYVLALQLLGETMGCLICYLRFRSKIWIKTLI